MDKRTRLKIVLFALVFIALCAFAASFQTKLIVYNPSESVPKGFYRYAGKEFEVGDIVLFPVPEVVKSYAASNYGGKPMEHFMKPVYAYQGEHICFEKDQFKKEGVYFADVKTKDRNDKPLPIWEECRNLMENEVFVFSNRIENSFDSRYYGAIKKEEILGAFKPFWTTGKEN